MAQDSLLHRQLKESQLLTTIIKPDSADMAFRRWQSKKILKSRVLDLAEDFGALKMKGPGFLYLDQDTPDSIHKGIIIEAPASLAIKNPTNRSYGFAEMIME